METLSFQVSLPSDLLSLLRLSSQEMEQGIQCWVALELFRMRKVSVGKATLVAGMSLYEFLARNDQFSQLALHFSGTRSRLASIVWIETEMV